MLDAQLEDFQEKIGSPFVDFTVDGYLDVDKDFLTSETHVMTDAGIVARVTQSQYDMSDVPEDDKGDEEEDIDWEMAPPRKDEICQVFESLRSCCLFRDDK